MGPGARLLDDRGQLVDEAGPAMPVEILGLDGVPEAGDAFAVVESEERAREITEFRAARAAGPAGPRAGGRGTLEEMLQRLREGAARSCRW